MGKHTHTLEVSDDPISEILYRLGDMPLERAVAYLVLIGDEALRLGLITPEDWLCVRTLAGCALASLLDKAA